MAKSNPKGLIETSFPNLRGADWEITSRQTRTYNCIAWAAGDETNWWQPQNAMIGGAYYWPQGLPSDETLANYIGAFKRIGYRECDNGDPEEGFEKVVLYTTPSGTPTHAARQLPNGHWTSKLGDLEDIRHSTPEGVAGTIYGDVAQFMRRKVHASRPHPTASNIRRGR